MHLQGYCAKPRHSSLSSRTIVATLPQGWGLEDVEIIMLKVIWLFAAVTMVLASVSPAAAVARLANATCPYASNAHFKVVGARGESDGVLSEYLWLRQTRPGWGRDSQALMQKAGRLYDLLYISKGKARQVICFDITDFFGKN